MAQRYRAFISYSHADEQWATWLQRALERYRVPARLRRAYPGIPKRLNPVFRDKEELASSADLGQSIRTALADSAVLLVVCSPASAASRWVNEEIRAFRELAPGRDILCMIVEGSLDQRFDDCAFPPALLMDESGELLPEPLAADVRAIADGRNGAFLKVVAGLLGVGIDDLRQREQQRKFRVLSTLAAGATAIAVLTIGLAINAHKARQEAEVRRDQAEELIGFMLGDLRGKLEPIGKLDILDAVGDKSMDYFAALGDKLKGEDALARVMALRQIGEVRFQQGQLEQALQAFSQSRDFAAGMHQAEPENQDYLFELGQAEFWVGYVAWRQKKLQDAEEAMVRYMAHTRALLERDPGNGAYRLELAYAFGNLGAVARERDAQQQALDYFEQSIATTEPLLQMRPDDTSLLSLLAESWSWVGSTRFDLGRLDGAEQAFGTALEKAQVAYDLGGSPAQHEEIADLLTFLGDIHLSRGGLQQGLARFGHALNIYKELVQHDAENAGWQRDRFNLMRKHAELALIEKRYEASREQLTASLAGLDKLAALDPSNKRYAENLLMAERLQLLFHMQDAQLDTATMQKTGQMLHQLKSVTATSTSAAEASETLGMVHQVAGELELARLAWVEALGFLPDVSRSNPRQKAIRARLYSRFGDDDKARVLANELRALGFDDPRYPMPPAEF